MRPWNPQKYLSMLWERIRPGTPERESGRDQAQKLEQLASDIERYVQDLLNERLAGREFIATDRFSVADITAVVAVDFARVVKHKPGEQHPHLLRWRAAMAQRPAMAL